MKKPQTAQDLLEAVQDNLRLDARIAESAAFDCERRLSAPVQAHRLRRAAEQLRVIVGELTLR